MTRLVSTMKWDARLQWRNGFYYAVMVVILIWSVLISMVPAQVWQGVSAGSLSWLLPAVVLGNLLIGTFYFMGGLLLLEKGEGTLEAQIVTPLRPGEYLQSKLATLTILSLVENSLLVAALLIFHSRFWAAGGHALSLPGVDMVTSLFLFAAGLILGALILCLAGFLVVIRYDSINEYLLPSIIVTAVISLPLVTYLAGWQNWLLYLMPLQAPLTLLQAAWQPLPLWQLVYGAAYSLLWVWLLYRAANKAFYHFVINKQGVSSR